MFLHPKGTSGAQLNHWPMIILKQMMFFKEMSKAFVLRRIKNLSKVHFMREKSTDYWTAWALDYWWWNTPLPVDADLLPEFVPGFKTPFRQCPPGVRPTLADDELTYLRKLARPLPIHFALGRNTKLQGLAAAILKLWGKSLIAKTAVKVGVQNSKALGKKPYSKYRS
uniref:Crs1 n=1 Tax=Arundo donax TaxID=35708 RepID=A0A0A9CR46_ARUDO